MRRKPVVLCIMDGLGLSDKTEHNAVYEADTPNLDRLMRECPFVKGYASGEAVGLPPGQMGNSEVGHLNMGAGRIIYSELARITNEIESGSFNNNLTLLTAIMYCKKRNTALHLYGLLGVGGVHSSQRHLYALLDLAHQAGLERVYVHAFLDGRDMAPGLGIKYLKELIEYMDRLGTGRVASVMGRYYPMDRDSNWDRTELGYRAMVFGEGTKTDDPVKAVQDSYDAGVLDEFVRPIVVCENSEPVGVIQTGDSVISFNFRPDRMRQMMRALCDDEFNSFARKPGLKVTLVCFVDYQETVHNKMVAFGKEHIHSTMHAHLSRLGLKQFHTAETEKYAHVTYFFNGGLNDIREGEEWLLIPSPKVATYDLKPEMSAYELCDRLCEAIRSGEYDFIVINYANADMVGHTGVESAVIKAVETVDECVGRTEQAIKDANGIMLLVADHGNAESLIDEETGQPRTSHTTNPVPFILVNADPSCRLMEDGRLCDIAPTLLDLMEVPKPELMTGHSLLIRDEQIGAD